MKIHIALFGLEQSVNRMIQFAEGKGDIEIVPFVYRKAEEAKGLLSQAYMCDVFLFTGPLPYLYAKEDIEKKRLPAVHVSFDEFMVSTALFRLKNEDGRDLNRMSIDIMDEDTIGAVLTELEISDREIYTYGYGQEKAFDVNRLIDFHLTKWKEKKIDFVLTSIGQVERALRERGVQCQRMKIPKRNMEKAIDEAITKAKFKLTKSAQIAVGFVKIKNFEQIVSEKGDFYGQERLLKLHQILLKHTHQTYASVFYNGNNQFVIFGTRGILDNITHHFRDFPLVQEIESQLELPVKIGFGLGLTAKQAEHHAKVALRECEQIPRSNCFIVNERNELIGPLGGMEKVAQSQLYRSLRRAKFNQETAQKIAKFSMMRGYKPFAADDLAEYLNVTKRRGEQTIQKLLKNRIIEVSGKEKAHQVGRPRKIYRLTQGVTQIDQ